MGLNPRSSKFYSSASSGGALGFTLLETLIALMILSSALLLLANSWSGSYAKLRKTQELFEMAALLERKMVEVEREYRGKPLDSIPEEKEEDFGELYPEYSWKLTSKKLEFPDLSQTLISRDGGADQLTLAAVKNMTDAIGKMVKEVTVTVIFKKSKKKVEHSITTYFVDYSKDASVSIPAGMIPGM